MSQPTDLSCGPLVTNAALSVEKDRYRSVRVPHMEGNYFVRSCKEVALEQFINSSLAWDFREYTKDPVSACHHYWA